VKNGIVGCIFARGGSKGVPRKNIRLLAGKPLIAYAIQAAQSSELIDRIVVSTDDEEIAKVAHEWGAEVPFLRPAELARDDSPEWLAWQHAIRWLQQEGGTGINVFVSVPPTAPLRQPGDLDNCIRLFLQGDVELVYTVTAADHNPYFNMVVLDSEGYARLVIPREQATHRRQDAPTVYDSATVAYVANPGFVLEHRSMFEGRVKTVVVPRERAVDLDSEMDFRFAEFILSQSPNPPQER
jgi:N-acylneuraminate cytidylyltransferase